MDHSGEATRAMVRCADCQHKGGSPYDFDLTQVTCNLECDGKLIRTRNVNARRDCKLFEEKK